MVKEANINLWIKDLISNEYTFNYIRENLRSCHRLRKIEGLKKLSNAEMVSYALRLYGNKKETKIKKKIAKTKEIKK